MGGVNTCRRVVPYVVRRWCKAPRATCCSSLLPPCWGHVNGRAEANWGCSHCLPGLPARPASLTWPGLAWLSCLKRPCPDAPQGNTLVLGGADIVDGSPVLDIKPYVPFCDCLTTAKAPSWVQVGGWGGAGSAGPAVGLRLCMWGRP